jgi:hypothetical protein
VVGIEIAPKLTPDDGWAATLNALFALVIAHPVVALVIFFAIVIVLLIVPGGVGPSWVKYRGATSLVDEAVNRDKIALYNMMTRRDAVPKLETRASHRKPRRGGRK